MDELDEFFLAVFFPHKLKKNFEHIKSGDFKQINNMRQIHDLYLDKEGWKHKHERNHHTNWLRKRSERGRWSNIAMFKPQFTQMHRGKLE